MKLKPSKCDLLKKEVKYLGHIVSDHGVGTDPSKIEAITDWPPPTTRTEATKGISGTVFLLQEIY